MMDMNSKVFSVESANRLLPTVRSLLNDAKRLQKEVRSRTMDWEFMQLGDEEDTPLDGRTLLKRHAVRTQIDRLVHKFNRRLELVEQLGGQVRDLDPGRVEFLSIRDGQIIVLCWREGEEKIGYWREYDTPQTRKHLNEK